MSHHEHTFDWKGLYFVARLLAIVVGGIFAVQYEAHHLLESKAVVLPLAAAETVRAAPLMATTTPSTPETFSSTTPLRVINTLTIANTIPQTGKFIAADLVGMQLYLYQDGTQVAQYPIITKGRTGTPWETPSGFYAIQSKEVTHFSSIGHVYMPYSMQFYGNYFIHGWTYYPNGTPVSASFSGGCIKLATADAKEVFAFADVGTKVFVYDAKHATPPATLSLGTTPKPTVSAPAYLVADVDTGDVYAESEARVQRPIASITKLMSALVANEVISLDKKVDVEEGELADPQNTASTTLKTFYIDDLLYPLLMQSNTAIADSLAGYYGKSGFVRWMNTTAKALDMASTTFADPSGVSADNVSTPDDLYRLGVYLANKKSFVLDITHKQAKTITSLDDSTYHITNTAVSADTALSIQSLNIGDETRRIAIIVLGSTEQATDTKKLADWIVHTAQPAPTEAACAACSQVMQYRKIEY